MAAPPGRGRAALIEAMRARAAVKPGPEAEPEEPPKPRGRAALLSKMRELQIGSVASTSTAPVQTEIREEPAPVEKPEPSVCSFSGTSGKPVYMTANYVRLSVEKDKGVFEYNVRYSPEVDAKSIRVKILNMNIAEMGGVKMFDGGSCLYLPIQLPEVKTRFTSVHPLDNTDVTMTVSFIRAKRLGECVHLFNVLFKRIMVALQYSRVGRNYYDISHSSLIPQYKLEVLPGYAVAVDEYEGGLMVCLDAQHRVLRTDTALDLFNEMRLTRRDRFKEEITRAVIGAVVLTKYNNKTYVIDDILWDCTPQETFKTHSGKVITFIEYYKLQHGLTITDYNQPLLLHVQKVHKPMQTEPEERQICLIPEFCFLTGLTDEMRADYRVTKEVAQFTRLTPHQRLQSLKQYMQNIKKCPKAQNVLSEWGMKLENATIDMNVRILSPEVIVFGDGVQHASDYKADWSGAASKNKVIGPVDMRSWVIIHIERDSKVAHEFAENMVRLSNSLGCRIARPRLHAIGNDKTNSYISACNEVINDSVQMVVIIVPSQRADLYSAIKKICCVQQPVPSQVILTRTLLNPKRVRTITLKIAMQITCKIGGSLWMLKIPCKGWMVIGIDVYHSPANKSKSSVCGFVSSINDVYTSWYSTVSLQEKEIGDHLKLSFVNCLNKYREYNGNYPVKIIIFRDGVGDGQLQYCKNYELTQFEEVVKQFGLEISVCMVVVQKRINTRIITSDSSNGNPQPGTVVDHTITKRHLYDYYLVPQSVNQGTVTPTHYIVVSDSTGIKPDHLQKLSYKLCHLYYNWSGTIRVPAPCQYAHKLAYLVGQYIGKVPAETLNHRLYYL